MIRSLPRALLGAALILLAPLAQAADAPARTIILAGKLFDARTGKLLNDQAIVVEGDLIKSVGARPAARPGDKLIDLSAYTVLPGLIDAHTHLTGEPRFGYEELGISTSRAALTGAKNALITLRAGFTSVRDVGGPNFADVALRDAIDAGDVPGPHMIASGPALGITGGHCDNNLLPFEYHARETGVADGVAGVQQKVREVIKYGASVIKFCATGGVLSKGDDPRASQYTLEEMKAIVTDAHRLGRKVAAHSHGGEGIIWASEAGVDSIEHGTYIDDKGIAVLKKNGTYMVPTIYLNEWLVENMDRIGMPDFYKQKELAVAEVSFKNMANAMKQGVKIAFGTDSAVYPHGLNARQFALYVKMGMTPAQAIQSATIAAADLLGWKDQAGAIEPGKWADLIAVKADPLADVRALENVGFVMKSGVVYKNE
jgi:imidazolonepropionase-like amidohydrolase